MAKESKPAEDGAEAPPKKSKKLLIIILAVVLLLLIAIGAGAMLLMKGGGDEADDEVAEEVEKPAKKKPKAKAGPPVFVNLDTFTVNLVPETGDQYLQVAITLELDDATRQPELSMLMPKIRNNVTLLLSSKKASELLPTEGKKQLALEITDEINSAIDPPVTNKRGEVVAPEGPVVSVLFTSFIIQ